MGDVCEHLRCMWAPKHWALKYNTREYLKDWSLTFSKDEVIEGMHSNVKKWQILGDSFNKNVGVLKKGKGNLQNQLIWFERGSILSVFQESFWKQWGSVIPHFFLSWSQFFQAYSASSNWVSHWEASLRWQLPQSSTWEMAAEFTDFHPPLHCLISHWFQRELCIPESDVGK